MVTLVIMDGWGLSDATKGNAIAAAKTPNIDSYVKYPNVTLKASGLDAGLPAGTQGNSEVGHMAIGAGRIVYQDLTMISQSIADETFFANPEFLGAVENCKKNNAALHLMGMITDAGVHSHNSHMFALLELAKRHGLKRVYVHAILDGRDTPPKSAGEYLETLANKINELGIGKIATIVGRYNIMDRDMNNERVERGFNAMLKGEGAPAADWSSGLKASYAAEVTDEFVMPIVLENTERITDGDSVIFFNYRKDRAKQITRMFSERANVHFVCMTEYDKTIPNVHIAFKPQTTSNHLGEWLSKQGKRNFRVAETEKYNHVTFYFNALNDIEYEGEERVLVPSEKVATFDLAPKMRAVEIKDKAIELIKSGEYQLGVLNFANPDMIGHTGVFEAAVTGVETVDACVGEVVQATLDNGGIAIVTADHGNAELMADSETGATVTSHTTNPVPLFILGAGELKLRPDGGLSDIAPTILELMQLKPPAEMTGKSLIAHS